jgi:RNA polymerase sigma-70 factor (ECF subfamily)
VLTAPDARYRSGVSATGGGDDPAALARVFVEHAAPGARVYASLPSFGDRLARLHGDARGARPAVDVAAPEFVAHLAARIALPEAGAELEAAFASAALHAADLYLAAGLARGHAAAIRVFEDELLEAVPRYVARFARAADATFVPDVKQLLRERMLVGQGLERRRGQGGAPRILDYDGRGPLGGLVRVAAIRAALDLVRRGEKGAPPEGARASDDAAIELAGPSADPETEYIKRAHTEAFRAAFVAALAELERDERTLLRLHHLEGLSIDQLAPIHGAHRATVARQLARARQKVLERTHAKLLATLGLSQGDLASLMDAVRSRFHLSLQQFLTPEEAEKDG